MIKKSPWKTNPLVLRWPDELLQQCQTSFIESRTHLRVLPVTQPLRSLSVSSFSHASPFGGQDQAQYEMGESFTMSLLRTASVGSYSDSVEKRMASFHQVVRPHILVTSSSFSAFLHGHIPLSMLVLVNVTVTEVCTGRTLHSSSMSQDQFDTCMQQCSGELLVEGALGGLAAVIFNQLQYSSVRVSFNCHHESTSEVSPLWYINLVARDAIRAENNTPSMISASVSSKPAMVPGLDQFTRQFVEQHHAARYTGLDWVNKRRLLAQDIAELNESDRHQISEKHKAAQAKFASWECESRQVWVDLANRQSPLVRPLVCEVNEPTVCFYAVYNLAVNIQVPVIARDFPNTEISNSRSRLRFRFEQPAHFVGWHHDMESTVSSSVIPIEQARGARCLRLPLLTILDICAYYSKRGTVHRQDGDDDGSLTPMEDAQVFLRALGAKHRRTTGLTSAAPVDLLPTIFVSHLSLDDISLEYGSGRQVCESFRLLLAEDFTVPCVQADVCEPSLIMQVKRTYESGGCVDWHSGFQFRFTGKLIFTAEQTQREAAEVEIMNKSNDQFRFICHDASRACSIYDLLEGQRRLVLSDNGQTQRQFNSDGLSLTTCLAYCFPTLSLFPTGVNTTTNLSSCSDTDELPVDQSVVCCSVNETFVVITNVSVERIRLIHMPNVSHNHQSSSAAFPVCMSSAPEVAVVPLTISRSLIITPLLDWKVDISNDILKIQRQEDRTVTLHDWLTLVNLVDTAHSAPTRLVHHINIHSARLMFELDTRGRALWQLGIARCGPLLTDVVTHFHRWRVSPTLPAAINTFVYVSDQREISDEYFPHLLTAVENRALAPFYVYMHIVMRGGELLAEDDVKQVDKVFFAMSSKVLRGTLRLGWLKDLRQLSALNAFVALQPHLPEGRLLIPVTNDYGLTESSNATVQTQSPFASAMRHTNPLQHLTTALTSSTPTPPTSPSEPDNKKARCSDRRAPLMDEHPHRLLHRVVTVHSLPRLLLSFLDMNSIMYGLLRTQREWHSCLQSQSAIISASDWSHMFEDRYGQYYNHTSKPAIARDCNDSSVLWTDIKLRWLRDQLIHRIQRAAHQTQSKSTSDKNIASSPPLPFAVNAFLLSCSIHYLAAVDLQCRFNTFQTQVMQQLPHRVVPQLHTVAFSDFDRPLNVPHFTSHSWSTVLPSTLYEVPEAIKSVLCVTPPFCADLLPRTLHHVHWCCRASDTRFNVRLLPVSQPFSIIDHPLLLPFMRTRMGGDSHSVWYLWTGPTYVYDHDPYAGTDGVRIEPDEVNRLIVRYHRKVGVEPLSPPVTVDRAVRLVYVLDSSLMLVVRHLPRNDRLCCYATDVRTCLQQKGVLSAVEQVQRRWYEIAKRVDGANVSNNDVATVVEVDDPYGHYAVEDQNTELAQESLVAYAGVDFPVCTPLMNALLERYALRISKLS